MTRARIALLAALALTLSLFGIGAARADDGPSGEVSITSITPSRIEPGDPDEEVRISGTFTNTTGTPLTWLTAEFWHYDGELTSFDHVDVALSTPADAPVGTRHEPGVALTEDTALAPGASVAFEVSAPVSALEVGTGERATIVGVHLRGSTSEDGPRLTVGRSRALLPHVGRAFVVASVNILTSPLPPQVHGANPVSEAFTEYLSSTLVPALDASEPTGVTTVIDPALYQAALRLADDGLEDATTFIEAIDTLRAQGRLWRLPHGNPNLARMPEELRQEVPAWADDVVGEALVDVPLAGILPGDVPAPTGFDHVLHFGTNPDFWHLYLLSPIASPMVLDDEPAPAAPPAGLPLDTEPWPALDEAVRTLSDGAESRADLTTEPDTEPIAAIDTRPLVMSSYSTGFESQDDAVAYLASSRAASFDPSDISFIASPSFVMGARTNEFPTTITNATPFDVYLRIVVRSDNPVRLTVPSTDILEIRSGESLTAVLTPQATDNGITTVHAQLESQSGHRFGPVVDIEITATEFGRVGWIIIIVSGAVVLGGTVWRIRAVQRERAKEAK